MSMSNPTKSTLLSSSFSVNKVVPSAHSTSAYANLPNVWHLRLGHSNVHALKLVLQSYNIFFLIIKIIIHFSYPVA